MSDAGFLGGPGDGSGRGPDDDVAAAGEYALSLLPAQERAAFERRLPGEPALRGLVEEWRATLAELASGVPEVAPPPRVLRAIEAELFPRRRSGPLGFLAGLLGGAVAALAALVALDTVVAPARVPVEIAAADGSFRVEGSLDRRSRALALQLVAGEPGADRQLQMWVLPDDGVVRSVGLLPVGIEAGDVATIEVNEALAPLLTGSFVEITSEPVGGSPGPGPTGVLQGIGTVPEG